jgi:hypothetical protein
METRAIILKKRKTTETENVVLERQFVSIPSFVFRDRSVAVLECLVEYLKDERKLSFHEIAVLLNRNDRTVWTVYTRAKKKRKYCIHR